MNPADLAGMLELMAQALRLLPAGGAAPAPQLPLPLPLLVSSAASSSDEA